MPPSKGCFYLYAAGPGSAPASGSESPPARREQRGIISNGVNLSPEFNATTGFTEHINTRHYFPANGRNTLNVVPRPSSLSTSIRPW